MKRFNLYRTILLVPYLFGFLLLFGCSTENHQIQGTFLGEGEAETWLVDPTTCEPLTYSHNQTGQVSVTGQQIGKAVTGTLTFPEFISYPLPLFGTNEVRDTAGYFDFTFTFIDPLSADSRWECEGTIIATDLTEDKIADSLQLDPDIRNACVNYQYGECVWMYIINSGELLSSSYQ